MRARSLAMIAVLSLVSTAALVAGQAKVPATDPELQKFQGTWVLVSAEMDGKPVKDADVKSSKITFVGDKVEMMTPHQSTEKILSTITKLDGTTNPKEMHWLRTAGPHKGKEVVAIYEFEGPDQYKIAFDPAGTGKAKEFKTKAGSGYIWHTWKRVK